MSLYDKLLNALPELTSDDFDRRFGTIELANDGDGSGDYILKWEYSKPIPKGFKFGK